MIQNSPPALRCWWTKPWAGGMSPGVTPAPQCSLSWTASSANREISVIQVAPLEWPPGTSLFLFLKILESPLFPGLQCHWALRTLCLKPSKDVNLPKDHWEVKAVSPNPKPVTAGAQGLCFQTPRQSRLFMSKKCTQTRFLCLPPLTGLQGGLCSQGNDSATWGVYSKQNS